MLRLPKISLRLGALRRTDFQSFRTRLVGGIALPLVALGALWTWSSWRNDFGALEREELRRVDAIARSLSIVIDGEKHRRIADSVSTRERFRTWEDVPSELFDLRAPLVETIETNGLNAPIETLRVAEDARAGVAAQPEREHRSALELILTTERAPAWRQRVDYLPVMGKILFPARGESAQTIVRREGGHAVAYAPVFNPWKEVTALVRVQQSLGGSILLLVLKLLGRLAFAGGLVYGVVLYSNRLSQRLVDAIGELERAVHRFGLGDWTTPFEAPNSSREFERLTNELERARQQVHAHIETQRRHAWELRDAHGRVRADVDAHADLLNATSHALRAPVQNLGAALKRLRRSSLTPEQEKLLHVALHSSHELLRSVDRVVQGTRIDTGTPRRPVAVDFELGTTLEQASFLPRGAAARRSLQFRLSVQENVPTSLSGDVACLRHLLDLLLDHAVRTTKRGSVTLRVARVNSPADRVVLHFEVSNTGQGLTEAQRNAILQVLQGGVRAATNGPYQDLAVASELCRVLGGELGVEGQVGQGSRLWFAARFDPKLAPVSGPAGAR